MCSGRRSLLPYMKWLLMFSLVPTRLRGCGPTASATSRMCTGDAPQHTPMKPDVVDQRLLGEVAGSRSGWCTAGRAPWGRCGRAVTAQTPRRRERLKNVGSASVVRYGTGSAPT